MGSRRIRRALALVFLITRCQSEAAELVSGGVHVPIVRKSPASNHLRRATNAGSIGLGDFQDITYNVLIQVGETHIPVVLDTGSSDLWVLSASCQGTGCPPNANVNQVPLYPLSSFVPAHADAMLVYGDSHTGTYAEGPIGSDAVSLAGLGLQGQYLAAINTTNTSVLQTDSGGIFGLGFPFNSLVWTDLSQRQNSSARRRRVRAEDGGAHARFPGNFAARWIPTNDDGAGAAVRTMQPWTTAALQSSIVNYGPLIPRLVAQGMLASPMISITLQRDTIQIGGNEGMLSVGQLPPSVRNESLTWVNVRGYPPSQGGLNPPSDAPGEVYPIAWEIPLDDVWFDGVKLERSKMTSPNITLSALIDTGNSLVRGPPDVVAQILSMMGGPRFVCSPPHTLAFQIGGRLFPVDPRDFVSEVRPGDPDVCAANVEATDVPILGGSGYLYSWNLGDPFLKGVLAAFHYGSLTRPSQDPPRVGLLSTVDPNAGKQLCNDKHRAELDHEGYPMIAEPAPASLPPARGTGVGGVPLAAQPTATQSGASGMFTNGVSGVVRIDVGVWTAVLVGFVTWTAWRIGG